MKTIGEIIKEKDYNTYLQLIRLRNGNTGICKKIKNGILKIKHY